MKKTIHIVIAIVAALALTGCGIFFPSAKMRAAKNTPGFKAGFSDGCASATTQGAIDSGNRVRDAAAYESDKNYRSGWASGYTNCRTSNTPPQSAPGSAGPIPDQNPGGRTY